MLIPNSPGRFVAHQDFTHEAAQVQPMRLHHFLDEAVPGNLIEKFVKLDVRVDQFRHRGFALRFSAFFDQFWSELRCLNRAARSGETACKPLGDSSHLIKVAHELDVNRSHFETSTRRLADEALLAKQKKRLLHWMAGNAEICVYRKSYPGLLSEESAKLVR